MLKPIEEEIAQYQRQISDWEIEIGKAKAAISALERLRARASGQPVKSDAEFTPVRVRIRVRRGDLKSRILSLLEERGTKGLNAALAAEITHQRGDPVDRNSVSSLLSRLKTDGVVEHDGSMYRLTKIKDGASGEHVH